MSYLRENKIWEEEDSLNWDVIEISKIDDKIIRLLIDKLNLDTPIITESFFIAFESLLKIGNRAEKVLDSFVKETDEIHNFKIDVFNFMLFFIKNRKIEDHLVPQLYHSDFIIRARTLFKIQQTKDKQYLKFILPLLNDPDDSVRWAVITCLDCLDLNTNPLVHKELKNFIEKESNIVIKEKIKEVFKKF